MDTLDDRALPVLKKVSLSTSTSASISMTDVDAGRGCMSPNSNNSNNNNSNNNNNNNNNNSSKAFASPELSRQKKLLLLDEEMKAFVEKHNNSVSKSNIEEIDEYVHGTSHKTPKTNTIKSFYDTFWDDGGKSEWDGMVADVEKRSPGWIKRFSNRLSDKDIQVKKTTYWDHRQVVHERFMKSPTILGKTPERADEPTVLMSRVSQYNFIGQAAETCFICNRFVAIGPYRFGCKTCNNVCHLECVVQKSYALPSSPSKQIADALSKKIGDEEATIKATSEAEWKSVSGRRTKTERRSHNKEVAAKLEVLDEKKKREIGLHNEVILNQVDKMKLSRDMVHTANKHDLLTCYFCKAEMHHYNKVYDIKHKVSLEAYTRSKMCIRIQSWARMIQDRYDFQKIKKGIQVLQRVVRAIQFGRKLENERKHTSRPCRLRIHNFLMFVPRDDVAASTVAGLSASSKEKKMVLFPHQHSSTYQKLGDMKSSLHDRYFGTDQKYLQTELDMSMFRVLKPGHQNRPAYLQTIPSRQLFTRGQLFLTVSVHISDGLVDAGPKEIDDGLDEHAYDADARKAPQIYRLDAPLKDVGLANMSAYDYYRSNNMRQPPSVADCELIDKNFVLKRFSISNPYVLLPACRSDVQIRLSISEVTDWPKAVLVGQARMKNVSDFILWKQSASIFQTFENAHWYDAPDRHDGTFMNIVYRSNINITCCHDGLLGDNSKKSMSIKGGDEGVVSDNGDGGGGGGGGSASHDMSASRVKREKYRSQIFEPSVTWSILTYTDDLDNQAGLAYIYAEESLSSSKKKVWLVLIDGKLMLYSPNNKQAFFNVELDIESCTVSIAEYGLIRVNASSSEVLFFRIMLIKESAVWFRKLYSISDSNKSKPYFAYLKQLAATKEKLNQYSLIFFDSRVQFILDEINNVVVTFNSSTNQLTKTQREAKRVADEKYKDEEYEEGCDDERSIGNSSVNASSLNSNKSSSGANKGPSLARFAKSGTSKKHKNDLIGVMLTTAIHASSVNQSHIE